MLNGTCSEHVDFDNTKKSIGNQICSENYDFYLIQKPQLEILPTEKHPEWDLQRTR